MAMITSYNVTDPRSLREHPHLLLWKKAARDGVLVAPKSFRDAHTYEKMPRDFPKFAWRFFCDTGGTLHDKEGVLEYIAVRKRAVVDPMDVDESTVRSPACHFLDSGSFSHWNKAKAFAEKTGKPEWGYYKTKGFRDYLDAYAEFVQRYGAAIDFCANVDVIGNPELTWRNQQYLERRGIRPVPVVHYGTDPGLKWLKWYVNMCYDPIALGGMVGSTDKPECRRWISDCFTYLCDTPDRLPRVRVHGFGVTVHDLMRRYPWWSVDSTSWTQVASFGGVLVPQRAPGGGWDFVREPILMKVSSDSPDKKVSGKHFQNLGPKRQEILLDWLAQIGVRLGKLDKDDLVVEHGVLTRHSERKIANLKYYERFTWTLPEYPWPYTPFVVKKGFGFYDPAPPQAVTGKGDGKREFKKHR